MKRLLILITLFTMCVITLIGLIFLIRLNIIRLPKIPIELVIGIIGAIALIIAPIISDWLRNHAEGNKSIKEAEQQRKERTEEITRSAKAIKGHAQIYRRSIHADPRITTVQILEMSHPLDTTGVYVRLRVNDDPNLRYRLNQNSLKAEEQHDPSALLKTERELLESLFSKALDPVEAITQYKRSVIIGDPGAGKSTLLKYLALKSAEGSLRELPDLPIHIELNAFATSGYTDLLEFAASTWESRYSFPKSQAAN